MLVTESLPSLEQELAIMYEIDISLVAKICQKSIDSDIEPA